MTWLLARKTDTPGHHTNPFLVFLGSSRSYQSVGAWPVLSVAASSTSSPEWEKKAEAFSEAGRSKHASIPRFLGGRPAWCWVSMVPISTLSLLYISPSRILNLIGQPRGALKPKPETLNTRNPKPETLNP